MADPGSSEPNTGAITTLTAPVRGAGATAGRPDHLYFDYRFEDQVSLHDLAQRNLERWTVTVSIRGAGPLLTRPEIGYAHVLIFNLEAGQDVRDFADRVSGEWVDHPSPGPQQATSRVLVLDRVWLRPDHRGDGLGPIIAAAVIERLGIGCHLAACYPAPFEEGREGINREASIEALGRLWAQVGFRHWSNGVWMLDLREKGTRATLAALIAARAISGTPTHLEAARHDRSSFHSSTG